VPADSRSIFYYLLVISAGVVLSTPQLYGSSRPSCAWAEIDLHTKEDLKSFWIDSTGAVWVSDGTRMYRGTGNAFEPEADRVPQFASDGIWGTGSKGLWLGSYASGSGDIYHFDGRSFDKTYQTVENRALLYFWGSGPKDVWGFGTYTVHWTGEHWTMFSFDNPKDVWGTSATDHWRIYSDDKGTTFQHWDGNQNALLLQIDQLNPNDTTEIGEFHIVSESKDNYPPEIQKLVDQVVAKGLDKKLFFAGAQQNSVWGSLPNDYWSVGNNGVVFHWDGKSWSRANVSEDVQKPNLVRVRGRDANSVWALTDRDDNILHFDGRKWSTIKYKPKFKMFEIAETNSGEVWGSSAQGRMIHLTENSNCDLEN
jgi:hypothetical protein